MKQLPGISWLEKIGLPEESVQAVAAVVVGLGSGALVLFFKQIIVWIHAIMYQSLGGWLAKSGHWTILLIPVAGGLLVGLLQQFVLTEERHHGVAGIMESVALAGGRLKYRRTPLKALASAISIGSGASVGPEDPSVQIGSSVGSMIGQFLHVSEDRTRVLVATGAAAGIATAFNAPIAGVFFAVELILGEYATSSFGMVVLGSVLASVLTRAVAGPSPAFPIPDYGFNGAHELPFYLLLGILAAPVALGYIRVLYFTNDWFHHGRLPKWLRPVLVGILLGAIGLFFPQVLGDSYEAVAEILHSQSLLPSLLFLLLALKLLLTALSLGSGFMGGVFAPSLFLGAALGGGYGAIITHIFPSMGFQPSAFALVGMAAVLAGAVRAPVTAIMLLFEMTNDFRIILPLMFAVVVSTLISQIVEEHSVYTLSLIRKGIRLQRGRDVDVLESLLVKDVMEHLPVTIHANMLMKTVSVMLEQVRVHGLPVLSEQGDLLGVITSQDIHQAIENDAGNLMRPVGEFCTRKLVVAYLDETVQKAMRRMIAHDIGRMPVVDRSAPNHLVGWLSRSALIRAYDLALVRRTSQRHLVGQVRLSAMSGAEVVEMEVQPNSMLDGCTMAEVAWPAESLVASIQRHRKLLIPHGQTRIRAGDRLAVMVNPADAETVKALAEPRPPQKSSQ